MFLINIDKKDQAYLLFFIDKALLYTWNIWLHSQKDIKAKQIVPTQCWKALSGTSMGANWAWLEVV